MRFRTAPPESWYHREGRWERGMPSRASCLSLLGGGVLLSGCHVMVCSSTENVERPRSAQCVISQPPQVHLEDCKGKNMSKLGLQAYNKQTVGSRPVAMDEPTCRDHFSCSLVSRAAASVLTACSAAVNPARGNPYLSRHFKATDWLIVAA